MFLKTITLRCDDGSPFPIDMLRYEQAFPKTTEDALVISSTFKRISQPADHVGSLVTIAKVVRSVSEPWAQDRWTSFGWSIYDVGIIPRH